MEEFNLEKIYDYVFGCVEEYKEFVGIDSFPSFRIVPKEITKEKSQSQGFDSWATTYYDTDTGEHTIEIWSNIWLPEFNAKYLVFHELTHIWDAEIYSQRNKMKYIANKGYTEYHAAQIDLLKALGAKKISKPFSFKIDQSLQLIEGEKTVADFVDAPRKLAEQLIIRPDFPSRIETLVTTLGAIFNYYGRRSICKMYCKDYDDSFKSSIIESFIGRDAVQFLNSYMIDWFDAPKVVIADTFNYKMYAALAVRHHFV